MPRTILVFLAVIAITGNCLAQSAPLRVGYLPATHDSLLFVAKERGFFADEGLNIDLRQFKNSAEILQGLIAQGIDIGIPGVAAPVMYIANGAPLQIVGGAAKRSAAVVVPKRLEPSFSGLNPQEKIKKFANLKVATVRQSTGDAIFRQAVKKSGLKKQVDIRGFESPVDALTALKSNAVDAAVLWSPHMTRAEAEGMATVLWMWELSPDHVCCRQVVHDHVLKEHRAEVVKYMRGLIRAMQFYSDPKNRSAVVAIVQKYMPSISTEVLDLELYGKQGVEPRTTISVDISADGIRKYLEAMTATQDLDSGQANSVVHRIDSSIIVDAYKSLGLNDSDVNKCVREGFLACPLKHTVH